MEHPLTRLLTLLELLQAYRRLSGTELARRLEVAPRTVRRYISTLQELGLPQPKITEILSIAEGGRNDVLNR